MNFITTKTLSKLLVLSEATVRRMVKTAKIPYVRIGKSIRFNMDTITD